jgi:transcriptional regulator with XRE-family HTH domain
MASFPKYLPCPDEKALAWFAERLKQARDGRSPEEVAKSAGVLAAKILGLEEGKFHFSIGQLREVLRRGYGVSFEDLLAQYCREQFPEMSEKRPFDRDYYYLGRLKPSEEEMGAPTPFLIGGDPKQYVWATPLRRLRGENTVGEFLELAPSRKKRPMGTTARNSHEGLELIYVIHGEIEVLIAGYTRHFGNGEFIHFDSTWPHFVRNRHHTLPAFLLIVRSLASVVARETVTQNPKIEPAIS